MPPSATAVWVALAAVAVLATLALSALYAVNRLRQLEARVARAARRVHVTASWAVDAVPPLVQRARRYASPDPGAVSELEAAREDVLLAPTARACALAHRRLLSALTRLRAAIRENPALEADAAVHDALRDVEHRARDVELAVTQHEDALRELANAKRVAPTRWFARRGRAARA